MRKQLSASAFQSCLHTRFTVTSEPNTPVALELIEVSDNSTAALEQFSLIFRGPSARYLSQQMYEMHHPQFDQLTLFVVPIGKTQDGFLYQVVFNRIKD